MALNLDGLEQVQQQLAEAIDQAGPDHEALLLTKLALLLSNHIGDAAIVADAISTALQDLPEQR